MADKSNKEIAADAGVKLALGLTAIFVVKRMLNPKPALTTRVKFNYHNTQVRKIQLGDGKWYEVDDPWTPNDLGHRLYTTMKGFLPEGDDALMDESDRAEPWREVAKLGIDRARWLHNYWLDKLDPEDTVYRWIYAEWANVPEWDIKTNALNMLTRAGVGF